MRFPVPGPWDPNCNSYRIRFCFEDHAAADKLFGLLLQAITIWSPALGDSSALSFSPDESCGVNWLCLCGPRTHPDTVILRLADEWESSIGYVYGTAAGGRHDLNAGYKPTPPGWTPGDWKMLQTILMAHELGRCPVIGATHFALNRSFQVTLSD